EWYGNVMLCRKVAKLMLKRDSNAGARVSLTVNGHLLAGDAVTVTPQTRNLTWVLAPGTLVAGDNEMTLYVERTSGSPLSARSATASQEGALPRQTIDLSVANPAPTTYLELASFGGARPGENGWAVSERGYLTFRLRLRTPGAVLFSVA